MTTEEILKLEKFYTGLNTRMEVLGAELFHLKSLKVEIGNLIAISKGSDFNGGFLPASPPSPIVN